MQCHSCLSSKPQSPANDFILQVSCDNRLNSARPVSFCINCNAVICIQMRAQENDIKHGSSA